MRKATLTAGCHAWSSYFMVVDSLISVLLWSVNMPTYIFTFPNISLWTHTDLEKSYLFHTQGLTWLAIQTILLWGGQFSVQMVRFCSCSWILDSSTTASLLLARKQIYCPLNDSNSDCDWEAVYTCYNTYPTWSVCTLTPLNTRVNCHEGFTHSDPVYNSCGHIWESVNANVSWVTDDLLKTWCVATRTAEFLMGLFLALLLSEEQITLCKAKSKHKQSVSPRKSYPLAS